MHGHIDSPAVFLRREWEEWSRRGVSAPEAAEWLLRRACEARASDLHLDPDGNGHLARMRIDGVLSDACRLNVENVVARLKVLAGLATYRTDLPQEGRIPKEEGPGVEVRVSSYPTLRGEKLVLRFLRSDAGTGVAELGLGEGVEALLTRFLSRREGMLLLTGPAGSGKTTTIYACLAHLARDRHVVTVEDPVERELPGVTQTEVNPAVGLDFARALRSLLRQDPEVIMVGEVRDPETAHAALSASLSGHLVISTVHAGSATGVFARLFEMGLPAHMLASAVKASMAQRLFRRLCACRKEAGGEWVASGCEECLQTGYRGRVAVAEWLEVEERVREAVLSGARDGLDEAAREKGLVPLREKARELADAGATTAEEIRRVLGEA